MNQIKVPYGAGRGALGMASAEQRLLAAMLREPGYIDKVSAQLRPEQFLQPQQKELYEAMLRCRGAGVEVSLATLRAFVSEEALNELSRLAAQYSDVNCTPEDIKLYLERIARGLPWPAAPPVCQPTILNSISSRCGNKSRELLTQKIRSDLSTGWGRKEKHRCRKCHRRKKWRRCWRDAPAAMS